MPSSRSLPRPAEVTAALGWLDRASLPLSELEKPRNLRLALDALTGRAGSAASRASGPSSVGGMAFTVQAGRKDLPLFRPVSRHGSGHAPDNARWPRRPVSR